MGLLGVSKARRANLGTSRRSEVPHKVGLLYPFLPGLLGVAEQPATVQAPPHQPMASLTSF